MDGKKAYSAGFGLAWHYPWLALLPLAWEMVLLGLAYLGLPAPWAWPVINSSGRSMVDAADPIRSFFPSALPGLADLQIQTAPAGAMGGAWWPGVLLVPLVGALVQGLFLGAIAALLRGRERIWDDAFRRAWRALPGLYILSLVQWLIQAALPLGSTVLALPIIFVLFPLLPYALVVLDLPFGVALIRSPGLLWGNLGKWFGLGWRVGLTTALLSLMWLLAGGSVWLALAVYPWLGTALVGGAVALTLGLEGGEVRPASGSNLAGLALTLILSVGAGWIGGGWADAWAGYWPTREQAIDPGQFPPRLLHVSTLEDDMNFAFSQSRNDLKGSLLEQSRFGWRKMQEYGTDKPFGDHPFYWIVYDHRWGSTAPFPGLAAGKLVDSRVAFLEIEGVRFPVGENGPYFVIPLPPDLVVDPPWPKVRALDAQGNPVVLEEGKRP